MCGRRTLLCPSGSRKDRVLPRLGPREFWESSGGVLGAAREKGLRLSQECMRSQQLVPEVVYGTLLPESLSSLFSFCPASLPTFQPLSPLNIFYTLLRIILLSENSNHVALFPKGSQLSADCHLPNCLTPFPHYLSVLLSPESQHYVAQKGRGLGEDDSGCALLG